MWQPIYIMMPCYQHSIMRLGIITSKDGELREAVVTRIIILRASKSCAKTFNGEPRDCAKLQSMDALKSPM